MKKINYLNLKTDTPYYLTVDNDYREVVYFKSYLEHEVIDETVEFMYYDPEDERNLYYRYRAFEDDIVQVFSITEDELKLILIN